VFGPELITTLTAPSASANAQSGLASGCLSCLTFICCAVVGMFALEG